MRIQTYSQGFDSIITSKSEETNDNNKQLPSADQAFQDENQQTQPKDKLNKAVDSLNEILEINNKNVKFVYHEGLEEYYVQLVDSETEEVLKEIPSKKILDAFYEMQKLVGLIDEKI